MHYGIKVVGIHDGFRGLVENRHVTIDNPLVSGILTQGGTFLGSSRDKPHQMPMGGRILDLTEVAVTNYHQLNLDCLVCLGGNGTQKAAWRLHEKGGLNVLTLPKTIDNDVAETDITFGFDSAMAIADRGDRPPPYHGHEPPEGDRVRNMGHSAGWLCLGAGIAGGADAILIPEIPYDLEAVAQSVRHRQRSGKRFSIIAVAEGIVSVAQAEARAEAEAKGKKKRGGRGCPHGAANGGRGYSPGPGTGGQPVGAPTPATHRSRGPGRLARTHPARRHADCLRPPALHAPRHQGRGAVGGACV
jgi:6-phosphofructokinase 1